MGATAARRIRVVVVATVVALAACTPEGGDPGPTATSSTTEPPTTTTTVASTTTTASLSAQVLRHRLDGGRLVTYDVGLDVVLRTESSSGGQVPSEILASIAGTLEQLLIEATEDTVEIAQRLDGEGSVTVESGGTTVTQEIGPQDVAAFGVGTPLLVTPDGLPAPGRTGAPAYFEAPTRILDVLQSVGPAFGDDPVDVGDSWTRRVLDPLAGPISVSVRIVGEDDSADGRTFAFEMTATATELPFEISYAEAIEGGWITADVAGALPIAEEGDGAVAHLTFREIRLEGAGSFDPIEGRLVEHETTTVLGYETAVEAGGEPTTLEFALELTMHLRLRAVAPATAADLTRVLSAYAEDPFEAAVRALPTPAGYTRGEFEGTRLATLFDKLGDTRPDLVLAGEFARFTGADGVAVDVGAITNGGALRGDPEIMAGLGGFWSGEAPDPTTVGGRPAVVVSIDGESWLIWASDTHTYVAIGEPDTARAVLAALADTVDPYLWQPGDCLDFSTFDGERPYSPFGAFGLVHCSADHQFEVLHSETLPEGPDAPFPDDLSDRVADACAGAFVAATGVTPIRSRLGYVRYLPDEAEWDRGARYIACVLSLPEDGAPVSSRGRLDADHPDLVRAYAAGTCLHELDPVPCTEPHSHEIVAARTYDAPPSAPRPGDPEALFAEVNDLCAADAADYGITEGPLPTMVGAFSDLHFAWNEGDRDYYCVVFAADEAGFAVEIVGSLTGEWDLAVEGGTA